MEYVIFLNSLIWYVMYISERKKYTNKSNVRATDFTDWCTANFLELNVSKTKELIFDFRRSQCPVQPATIGTDTEYKYLGT